MPNRPKHLNLLQIRLPMPALVSILHRISGALLFLALPFTLWWLQSSLGTAGGFEALQTAFSGACFKLIAIGLVWGFLHHVCAGVRHLLLDLDIGTELASARFSSGLVLVVSLGLTVVVGALLW